MPRLRDVLEPGFQDYRFETSEAFALRDAAVVEMKLATGAPCDSHSELFAPWPGPERFVRTWYILDVHKAVGVNDDPVNGLSFPVIDWERG